MSKSLQCVLLGLLLGLASAADDNYGAAATMDALHLNSAHWGDLFKHNSWFGDLQEKLSKPLQMASCNPSDTHCTTSKTGSTNSRSSSSSIFGGKDEDYHCQVSADGRSKSCSYSSSSGRKLLQNTGRKLLQNTGIFSCAPGDEHCTTSTNGGANSNAFSSSIFGGNDQEMNCQVSADGMSKSCSSSSSSGGGNANASGSSQSSRGFWSSVGTAATTWWVWVLVILAGAVALFTLAKRRNIYVLMHGGQNPDGSYVGLPRFNKGRDNKEAQLY